MKGFHMDRNCECKVRGLWKFPKNGLAPLVALDTEKSVLEWIDMIESGIVEFGLKAYNGALCVRIGGLSCTRWACFYSEHSDDSGRLMILDDYRKFGHRNIPR